MKKTDYTLFDKKTQAFIYSLQANAIQRMLDFDYICKRETPSVAAVVDPFRPGLQKVFWGSKEILIPVYATIKEAVRNHPDVDVMINFASFRSAYPTTYEALNENTIRVIVIIAEGIPEAKTKKLIAIAKKNNKIIIGPSTVGGLVAGGFRIGNTAGAIGNIVAAKLYRPGSVGVVSKSGGLLNEIFNMVALNSNGVFEGVAIGGDRYPGSTLLDHITRYEANPKIKMIVALGEVGGTDEYQIVEALKHGKITKQLVMWVIGTAATVFPTGVQFGHAGAMAESSLENADVKNRALREAGAIVPDSFDDFGEKIHQVYEGLKAKGEIPEIEEFDVPQIPMPYQVALSKGIIRKPANFVTTISDDRGEEPTYAGIPISEIIEEDYSIGDIIGLLWFRKKLPKFATGFIEMVLKIVADHGPAVSGAHNAIVAARAGKDLISALCSGLLTIGPRFGGAIDGAARYFSQAKDSGMKPADFVDDMKAKGIYIPGIGHRIKSVENPDRRVELLKDFARRNFPKTDYLDYALEVEKITTQKRNTLILNVDGCVGILFLDMLKGTTMFTDDEIREMIEIGYLNTMFVLGRSIGIIGHILDQKRLKAGLYRHPWDDILYYVERGETGEK
ncbi:MAG: citrate/2-methylcitrate synthase [Promethearchaeota archaeon]